MFYTHSSDGVHKSNPGQWKLRLPESPFPILFATLEEEIRMLSRVDVRILRS